MAIGIFYEHLSYFITFWYILCSFDTFFRFWCHAPRKIWQPCMRQPDMAFCLCQESSHLQAGSGCSGTPFGNIRPSNSMRCRAFAGYYLSIAFVSTYNQRFKDLMGQIGKSLFFVDVDFFQGDQEPIQRS
jgi:hypothetical protein